ncbi:CDP-diacylglycerol diphosphatase [Aliirhizobium terrae]|uniref:CDP-diacylglycerol pyrophosphatase n=1 Tax=Terrirhizobium terrae TaxID=2926709 RepID=UPI0025765BF0|nr:CDP-diacylglycerol diphosphatase [Rhizobium sp. CC-CFT758]WJH41888.1 CDP-diacylglycerol diphosphatase [Rhizobium sp. CC-CFT758]
MRRGYVWAVISASLSVVLAAFIAWMIFGSTIFNLESNALWRIEQACLASPAGTADPPCILADPFEGYVLIKDRKGSSHYLLLPTKRVSGIENDELLSGTLPNYFELAWSTRKVLSIGRAAPLPDQDVLLAINSKFGRSQGQLHIHISCAKPQVGQLLARFDGNISETWTPFPVDLEGHQYFVRRISLTQFEEVGAFRVVALGMPRAAMAMDRMSIAMAAATNGEVILLATERDLFDLNLASAEELQDHDCTGR